MRFLYFIGVLVLTALFPYFAQASELEITNIRVGQGDATLIQGLVLEDGSQVTVLFDAGTARAATQVTLLEPF